MPVATSIVMDVVSFASSRAVSLHVGALKHTMISRRRYSLMLPIQRSTTAEGSVGGVGRRIHDYLEAAGRGTTSKGRCSSRSATTAPAASIRRSSLKAGIVARSVMLRKLAAYRRQNQLDLALQELGRIERTLFMLDWLESPQLRRRCHAGLTNSEQRHFLAQVICTFKQGRQTRPANKAGLPTAVPRRSSFVPPASTSSSPQSCSGTPPTSPTPSPISVRLNNRCPMHGSPIHRRSAGGTSASPAIFRGSGPSRPQISAAPSISARRESLHDPRLSQSVRP